MPYEDLSERTFHHKWLLILNSWRLREEDSSVKAGSSSFCQNLHRLASSFKTRRFFQLVLCLFFLVLFVFSSLRKVFCDLFVTEPQDHPPKKKKHHPFDVGRKTKTCCSDSFSLNQKKMEFGKGKVTLQKANPQIFVSHLIVQLFFPNELVADLISSPKTFVPVL